MAALPPTFPKVSIFPTSCMLGVLLLQSEGAPLPRVPFLSLRVHLQGLRVLLVDGDHTRPAIEGQLRQPELQYIGE